MAATGTMTTNHEVEAQMAEDTGHELGCLEWGLEILLEAGADEHEVYALWLTGRTGCWCEAVRP